MCFLQTFCVLESKHHAFCRLREVFAPSVLAGRALRAAYCRFLLASLQLAHIFPEVQRPKADAVLQLRSCQFPGERKDFSLCLGSVYDPVQCVFSFSPAEQRRAACSTPGPRTPPAPSASPPASLASLPCPRHAGAARPPRRPPVSSPYLRPPKVVRSSTLPSWLAVPPRFVRLLRSPCTAPRSGTLLDACHPRVAGLQAHPWVRSFGLRLLRGIFL